MTSACSGPLAQQLISWPHPDLDVVDMSVDAATEQAVRVMLADSPLSRTAYISVTSRNGVVTLDGTVSDGLWLARFKNQVTSALPTVAIDDRLEWVVPECGIGVA